MRLLRVEAVDDPVAPAARDAYRVNDDLDAQALPDFNLITAEGVEPAEGADSADAD